MEPDSQFQGYSLPTSNTTYTPNQFFDVVLPHASRGTVRLVAYMIRKTLGWSDQDGNPQEPQVHFSYRDLEQKAGIGHSMIRSAIDQALSSRYIRCLRAGTVNTTGTPGVPALYELNWDDRGEYLTDPDHFNGFFAGNGNLTYIPNDFFDHTIPTETLALVRVVGAIVRHTIGFQTHFGFRRQKVAMSVTEIQKKTGIKGRQHIVQALQEGQERNHIVRLEAGFFDPNAGKESHAAVYGIRWKEAGETLLTSRQTTDTPKRLPDEPERETSRQVTDTPKKLPEKSAGDTPKRLPGRTEKVTGGYTEKVTDIKITINNTPINNNNSTASVGSEDFSVAVAEISSAPSVLSEPLTSAVSPETILEILREVGFDLLTAQKIASGATETVIRQQVEWLSQRNPSRNRLGMLRRAIEENWPAPTPSLETSLFTQSTGGSTENLVRTFAANFYAGWAGNPGIAIAFPSVNDLTAAEAYVQILLKLSLESTQVMEWGRAFGIYARKAEQNNPKAVRSLVFALRGHGDAFYLSLQSQYRQSTQQAHREALKAHEARFQDAYRAYLLSREREIQTENPDSYALFADDEEAKRRKFQTGIFANSRIAERILKTQDTDEERSERFRQFFQREDLPEVLDFWAWDRLKNPECFKAGECL